MAKCIFILEDHEETALRLENAVSQDDRLKYVGRATCLADARIWQERGGAADVILVDLGLPDGSGIDFIKEVTGGANHTVALVITVFGDEKHVVAAIEAGAMGYLLKDGNSIQIADAICSVLDGGSPMSPNIARFLLKRFQAPPPTLASVELTAREKEVMQLVVKGYSYKELADHLGLSIHTVTSHIQHIYRKLAVRSRGEAVFEALQLGLVDMK